MVLQNFPPRTFIRTRTFIRHLRVSTVKGKHYCKVNKTPVNVSRACIIIPAGYTCDVRNGTALDQALHFPSSIPRPTNIRVVKKISKIVLGLEVESQFRDNPSLGVAVHICNFWGPHKQTNKHVVTSRLKI